MADEKWMRPTEGVWGTTVMLVGSYEWCYIGCKRRGVQVEKVRCSTVLGGVDLDMMVDFQSGKDDMDALDARGYIHCCLELRYFHVAKKKNNETHWLCGGF